jgi:hypothetical protein
MPESFKLLSKQLQGLGLGINVIKKDGSKEDINDFTSTIINNEIKTEADMKVEAEILQQNAIAAEDGEANA